MYANLKVVVDGVEHTAWKFTEEDGRKTVHLDDNNDGMSSHYEEAGTLDVTDAKSVEILASF